MIKAKINGRPINLPSGWHEIDTETFQRIKSIEEPTLISLFSAVAGFDYQLVAESSDMDLELAMYQVTSFIVNTAGEEYFRNAEPPQYFTIQGKQIKIEKNIEAMTIEQNLVVRQKLANLKFIEQAISFVISVYLQPKIDGKFDLNKAKEIEKEVLKMPIEDTFPLGFFLLNRLQTFGKSGVRLLLHHLNW
jgi:hypothetical protein